MHSIDNCIQFWCLPTSESTNPWGRLEYTCERKTWSSKVTKRQGFKHCYDGSIHNKKTTNVNKFGQMIKNGVRTDTTLVVLRKSQPFLQRNYKQYEHYDKMRPVSNKPARLYGC